MYAFGDAMLFLAVFGFAAHVPAGLGVCFLRTCRWFWTALSIVALAIAITGGLAAAVFALAACQALPRESPLMTWAALAVLRLLAMPLLAAAFALCGLIAPARWSRWSLLAAAGIEGAVATYAVLHCVLLWRESDPMAHEKRRQTDGAERDLLGLVRLTLWHTKNAARRPPFCRRTEESVWFPPTASLVGYFRIRFAVAIKSATISIIPLKLLAKTFGEDSWAATLDGFKTRYRRFPAAGKGGGNMSNSLLLTGLLLLALVMGVAGLEGLTRGGLTDEEAVTEIERLGGSVTRDERLPSRPVISVNLSGTRVTDADLKHVGGLTQLENAGLARHAGHGRRARTSAKS